MKTSMTLHRAAAVAGSLCILALTGCQQVTYPDGRVGFSISPANVFMQGQQPGQPPQQFSGNQEANDPYVRSIVPDEAIFSADRKFGDRGVPQYPAFLNQCAADARRGRSNIPECWALDIHAWIVNTAMTNVAHRPSIPALETGPSKRRWRIYATALGVPPDRYKLVEDGTFQRVLELATNNR